MHIHVVHVVEGSLICSTLREQQPTVSADSSESFSLPARNASCRDKEGQGGEKRLNLTVNVLG